EIFEDRPPLALVLRTATMALVDDDAVEEVGWVIAEPRRRLAILVSAGHKGLKDREEHAGVLRHRALLADLGGTDPSEGIIAEGIEAVVGLVRQDVTVGQEQDARA